MTRMEAESLAAKRNTEVTKLPSRERTHYYYAVCNAKIDPNDWYVVASLKTTLRHFKRLTMATA